MAEIEILDTCVSQKQLIYLINLDIYSSVLQIPNSLDYMRWADCFLVVYSVVDRHSFYEAEKILQQLTKLKLPSYYSTLIVGNKCDLEHNR